MTSPANANPAAYEFGVDLATKFKYMAAMMSHANANPALYRFLVNWEIS